MEKENQSYKMKKRELGDEWEGWTGGIEENSGDLDTSPKLFLSLLTFSVIFVLFIQWIIYMLTFPYFNVHSSTLFIVNFLSIGFSSIIISYYGLLLLTLWLKKPVAFFLKDKHLTDWFFTNLTLNIGKKLNISHDRMINSMLKINNSLTTILYGEIKKEELLILVPRCLSKQTRIDLQEIMKSNDLNLVIASGGTQARNILKEKKPKGIIAVACERDLFAGVNDVPPQIPVIAVANKRPEGPCRNTLINRDEIEEAIDFFLNK